MMNLKFGLGPTTEPIHLFVKHNKDENGESCWYTRDQEKDLNKMVYEPAVTGILYKILVKKQVYKKKENFKVDFFMDAGRNYIIRSGDDTTFTRGVLQDLLLVPDLGEPLCIGTSPGDSAVYGRVYNIDGVRYRSKWDASMELFPVIQAFQKKLGQEVQTIKQIREEFEKTADRRLNQNG